MTSLQKALFELSDEEYRVFHSRLMPTVDDALIMGVRTPVLRKFSNEFSKTEAAKQFLNDLPHKYYEENNLHAFLLEKEKDYGTLIKMLDRFLPFVDNWATCDMMKPKILKKHTAELIYDIDRWINSSDTYAVRYGINCLMTYYLDESFKEEYFQKVVDIKSDEYYINMMRAWYFAAALTKQYGYAVKVFENRLLDNWTHNKAIQKAVESYRIASEKKVYLKSLKI